MVKGHIGLVLDGSPVAFNRILMLVVWLGLVISNAVSMENILGLVADLGLGAITDELIHCSPFVNVVFKSGNKGSIGLVFHTRDVRHKCLHTKVQLSTGSTIINSGHIRENTVSGNRFIASVNIETRELALEMFVHG